MLISKFSLLKRSMYVVTCGVALIVCMLSCNRPSADQFFQTTILNTNILHEFASEQFTKTLWSTTASYPDDTSGNENVKEAQQIVEAKIAYIEQTISRIEAMTPPDEEAEVIKEKSLDLYRFALPVYKNEYTAIAVRCDEKGAEEEIQKLGNEVVEKYAAGFEDRYDQLLLLGKAYAEEHSLNVQFGN
ncbi:hypothetical protein PQ465_15325 [Sphingobacterium oryzagri]|uniref:DUF4142 domain-containing protein n=1 Tax=Sphingobacterium oryzagri TaxID=3025669 RepID=A0ABY7WDE1_9SPHI|nr:hypothetical protein [Sphingobacterium sp. KACC 22765]WDF67671.1 hypothetical protein PQ465_15325 [Sphingobacterium sp. KACC 22765]